MTLDGARHAERYFRQVAEIAAAIDVEALERKQLRNPAVSPDRA